LPAPRVKKGKWSKERERTKSGKWRKKRSDANRPRKVKKSRRKIALIALGALIIVVVLFLIIYFFFPSIIELISNAF
jgi:cell division septal protein FtsQ